MNRMEIVPGCNGNRIPWHLLLPRYGKILFMDQGEKTRTAVLAGDSLDRAANGGRKGTASPGGNEGSPTGIADERDLFDTVIYFIGDTGDRPDPKTIEEGLQAALSRTDEGGRLLLVVESHSLLGIGSRLLFGRCRRFLRRHGGAGFSSMRLYRGSVQEWYGVSGGNWRAVDYYLQELTAAGSWPALKSVLYRTAARLHLHRWEVEHRILMVGKAKG